MIPPIAGLEQVDYLTNSSMMDVDFLPRHLVIMGGSYIGLEFGQMYRRFGSQVTIIESGPRLIPREDEDISAAILDILGGEGIDVRLNTKDIRFVRRGDDVVIRSPTRSSGPTYSSPSDAARTPTISDSK